MAGRATGGAKHRLMVEMQELSKENWVNIDVGYPHLFHLLSDLKAHMPWHYLVGEWQHPSVAAWPHRRQF